MHRPISLLLLGALGFATSVQAQTTAVLEVGPRFVEYDGFLSSGALVASPAVMVNGLNSSIGVRSTWVVFESGNQIFQVNAAGSRLFPLSQRVGVEVSGATGATKYTHLPLYGHFFARTRLYVVNGGGGFWMGAASGTASANVENIPYELTFGAWRGTGNVRLNAELGLTGASPMHYADLSTSLRWTGSDLTFQAHLSWRPVHDLGGAESHGPFAEMSLARSVHDRVTAVLSGGSTASDPVRGILASKFFSLGFRVQLGEGDPAEVPYHETLRDSAIAMTGLPSQMSGRLLVYRHGHLKRFEVTQEHVGSVEIMAEFTDWKSVPLVPYGAGVWIVDLPVDPGVYRLNIRFNGGPWVVPAGTRSEQGEFGGAVGILLIQ